jgi:hypothetical protein
VLSLSNTRRAVQSHGGTSCSLSCQIYTLQVANHLDLTLLTHQGRTMVWERGGHGGRGDGMALSVLLPSFFIGLKDGVSGLVIF